MSRKIVAGNWKMNKSWDEAKSLISSLNANSIVFPESVQVIIAPPAPYLRALVDLADGRIAVAAQNCSDKESGAFTGEWSAKMLASCGVSHVIIGHSERRAIFGEDNALVAAKVKAVLDAGLKVIFCCGESLEERESNRQKEIVLEQLRSALLDLSAEELSRAIIAYEPVWAIGTGKTASDEQVQEMHDFIRKQVRSAYGVLADLIPILYGGSCKASNAAGIFSKPDVDGGLIGGASLNAEEFTAIIQANA